MDKPYVGNRLALLKLVRPMGRVTSSIEVINRVDNVAKDIRAELCWDGNLDCAVRVEDVEAREVTSLSMY